MTELIQVDQQHGIFYLSNSKISYIFRIMPKINKLEHIYFGKRITFHPTIENEIQHGFTWGERQLEDDNGSSLSRIMQEFPEGGTGDYRLPAFEITYPSGDSVSNFIYDRYQIIKKAPDIKGLPHVRYDNHACETLSVVLKDQYSDLELILNYTIDPFNSFIVRNTVLKNLGDQIYKIDNLKSLSLDLPNENFDVVSLNGTWARERHVQRQPLGYGIQGISSSRGASGHVHDPFVALAKPDCTQNGGDVYGISTIYSGNHKETVELDTYGVVRVIAGINDEYFTWNLVAHQSFSSPQSVLVFSDQGFNGMSQAFHDLVREHLVAPQWRDIKHPVLINNWEATYFDFDENKILELADKSSKLGCDLFVLDDGWFGQRNSEKGSLGNWTVDTDKLPHGLNSLSNKIHDLGMKFGLWFEPESVSSDVKIFKEHPNWVIGVQGKKYTQGRNQFLLDFSNSSVVDNIFQQMDRILSETKIDYIKWDMNRNITEPFSSNLNSNQQGEFYHRYILGVYDLYNRLLTKYPQILFESCASGGGRFDLGMLYYAPQTWVSDDTDAYERWQIQTGTSYVYPLSTMGTHVSVIPNHQTGRLTPLKTRGNIAMFGTFGYEMDLTKLTDSEEIEIKRQIVKRKKYDKLITQGKFYRLETRSKQTDAWMVVSEDKKTILLCYFQKLSHPNRGYDRVRLYGLDKNLKYQVNQVECFYGDELMNIGLPLNNNRDNPIDFDSELFEIKSE